MIEVIWSPHYLDYGFGEGHPWWPERSKKFLELLKGSKIPYQIVDSAKATDDDILLAHSKEYLARVKKLAQTYGFLSADTPVTPKNLEAAYFYVGGTICACNLALKGKLVFNTLGGLHHAGVNDASGFCIFNDHAIAIKKLRKERKIKNAFILDLDVHAGNGTQEIFWKDQEVFTLSIHQDPTFFYPGTGFANQIGGARGEGFNLNIPLPPGTGEDQYLAALRQKALPAIDKFKPDLLLVVLGADTFVEDPLASFQLGLETYGKIAQSVKPYLKNGGAILAAGGYSRKVPEIWFEFLKALEK